MASVLDEICARKRRHVADAKARRPLSAVIDNAVGMSAPRGFTAQLGCAVACGGYGLIAEIKRSSPSKGLIRKDFDPASLARTYEKGGASCLSVLTDAPSFGGADDHLSAARAAVELPVLRKDFMIDPYQIVESRALGADCVLLILAALDDDMARELEDLATSYGMDVLIEVHDAAELERALAMRSPLIGINNRDLKTLETDIETTRRLAPKVPEGRDVVSESGLFTPDNLADMARAGARRFLIGESLMRQDDVAAATAAILTPPRKRRKRA
jgi:indole-3-glycerol phosphate synthase